MRTYKYTCDLCGSYHASAVGTLPQGWRRTGPQGQWHACNKCVKSLSQVMCEALYKLRNDGFRVFGRHDPEHRLADDPPRIKALILAVRSSDFAAEETHE